MKKISSSPDRYTFGQESARKKLEINPSNDTAISTIEYYNTAQQNHEEKINDPTFQKNNLEYDLRSTDWILEKTRNSETYAQNLYAALCNNDFVKREMWPILKDERWSCSWRYAGGIIADMREEGDYIDWYCSGIRGFDNELDNAKVAEGEVTEEIKNDLYNLGWLVIKDNE